MASKFSEEEKFTIQDNLTKDVLKVLLHRIEILADNFSHDVLTYDLQRGSERELVFLKSQADGAKKLYKAIELDLLGLFKKVK